VQAGKKFPNLLGLDADYRSTGGLSSGDLWHSEDYGDHWQRLPFNLTGIHRSLIMVYSTCHAD
jgi:hypothetical protein